ncbi:MAG: DUF4959 domain-containing protein [Bacteroidales bacterium]|jgi:hypothetical protein|nr:DUF4959 domain-containing protein [Bacteroidales bacterium]
MKTYLILFSTLLLASACAEDPIGQYPVDSTPPQPLKSWEVINFAGGSTISYELPDETDLLYVKTQFTLPNGEKQDIRASVFSNVITIKGFARSQKYTLQLVTVDRSQNESEPTEVEIHPENAVIYDLVESIQPTVARGGFKVTWENAVRENVVVTFLRKNDDGGYELLEAIYSSELHAQRAIRDQKNKPTTFAVFARDMYNNYTDTMEFTLTPLYEEKLNKDLFQEMPKLSSFVLHNWGKSTLSVIWDNTEIAGAVAGQVYYIQSHSDGVTTAYFTLDLGVKAKLSRFRMWGRSDYYFRLHNPYDFYLMGTNEQSIALNAASTDEEWGGPLINCISYRPSGLDSSQPATADDLAFAQAGEEFEFTGDEPAVRYIRFRVRRAWGGSIALHVAELSFWGEPITE